MRKFSWFRTFSSDEQLYKIQKTELTDMPAVGPDQMLVKVSACLLSDVCRNDSPLFDCNDNTIQPLSTDIIGRVEKTGENVVMFNVGDVIMAVVDFDATKQSGCCNYCVVDEACSILKPSSLNNQNLLCCFSDMLQIEMLLNFLPKFPIKYSFLISGNALLPLNQLLIQKLLMMECKVIACVDKTEDCQMLSSIFKDLVIVDTNNYNELSVAIMEETCGIGVSAVFHLGGVLDGNYANSLLQCLSFNGTLVVNRTSGFCSKDLSSGPDSIANANGNTSDNHHPQLPLSLFDSFWHKKSAVLHYFNFNSTIHCGYFVPSFQELGKKIFESIAKQQVLPINKNVIPLSKLEDFINQENFLNSTVNYKVIVTFNEQSSD